MNQQSQSQEAMWPLFIFFAGLALVLVGIFAMQPPKRVAVEIPPTETPQVVAAEPTPAGLTHMGMPVTGDPGKGEQIYQTTCAACHNFNAQGISGLGKPLIGTDFVKFQTDAQLVGFIAEGRSVGDPENTTGVAMPARGNNMSLTDDDLYDVVAYLRLLNSPQTVAADTNTETTGDTGFVAPNFNAIDASGVQPSSGASGEADITVAVVAEPFVAPDINALDSSAVPPSFGASGSLDLSLSDGSSIYAWSCAQCHGIDGSGAMLYPVDISNIDGEILLELFTTIDPLHVRSHSFIHAWHGGFPELTEAQLQELTDYLQTFGE